MIAKYTMYLKTIMDSESGKVALNNALSKYPVYQSETAIDIIPSREELNNRLLNHYKYREIGFETPGRFIDELEITMNEIMPYYNELYKTVEIMHNIPSPFDNVDVIETYQETRTGSANSKMDNTTSSTSNGESSTTNTGNETASTSTIMSVDKNNKTVTSGTPQDDLSITSANINNVSYADEVIWNNEKSNDNSSGSSERDTSQNESSTVSNTATGESNSNSESSSTESIQHTFSKKGNQGVNTYAHDMNEFRTSIIDVTNQIINDERIAELFMTVF